jgi:hypothetical protein
MPLTDGTKTQARVGRATRIADNGAGGLFSSSSEAVGTSESVMVVAGAFQRRGQEGRKQACACPLNFLEAKFEDLPGRSSSS